MCNIKNVLLLAAVISLITVELPAQEVASDSNFSIRKVESQAVLYTVYRGPYEKMGMSIGQLYALAAQNHIKSLGPVSLVYLNNPQNTTQEHFLIEIRIPVDANDLQKAGTLGPMTDVKTLKASQCAIMKKQAGQTDYETLYRTLYERIAREGYHRTDNAVEVFAGSGMGSDYSQMTSEIMIPVMKNTSAGN